MAERMGLNQVGRVAMARLPILIASFAALFLLTGTASAQQQVVEKAKLEGQIGEQFDGYLGVRAADATEEVKKAVEDTNARRLNKYTGVAEARELNVEAVARLAGDKLTKRAKVGHYIKAQDGKWVVMAE
jgi:uncharacterized protein YdbL (DUF1318 family)